MMLLDAQTKSLEVQLAGAVASAELEWTASYLDVSQVNFGTVAVPRLTA